MIREAQRTRRPSVPRLSRRDPEVHERLLHDAYDIPPELNELRISPCSPIISCPQCEGSGETVDTVRHESWCVYADGLVCPLIPN